MSNFGGTLAAFFNERMMRVIIIGTKIAFPTVGRNRSIGSTNVNVSTSTKCEEKMTKKYIAVSLVTVSRMFRVFESQRWVFKARVRRKTTKNAARSNTRESEV